MRARILHTNNKIPGGLGAWPTTICGHASGFRVHFTRPRWKLRLLYSWPAGSGPGSVNDAYFRFVTDMGATAPNCGKGGKGGKSGKSGKSGKILILPPGYKGDVHPPLGAWELGRWEEVLRRQVHQLHELAYPLYEFPGGRQARRSHQDVRGQLEGLSAGQREDAADREFVAPSAGARLCWLPNGIANPGAARKSRGRGGCPRASVRVARQGETSILRSADARCDAHPTGDSKSR